MKPTATASEARLPLCVLLFVLSILAAGGAFAKPSRQAKAGSQISLADYLTQVSTKNLGYRATDQTAKAARQYSSEGSLLYKPNFFATATSTTDGRNNPLSSDGHTRIQNYNLGISQQTTFGLSGKLSYNYFGLDIPTTSGYSAGFGQIELSQSLLRNWLGSETRFQSELIESGALAKSYTNSFLTKNALLEAESTYWRLALAREMVEMQRDSVERAQRISDWTSRRVRLQLADRAENLQASTNLQARKLDLRTAEDEERAARQAFNSSRSLLSDDVPERLSDLSPDLVATMSVPARTIQRDDVKAAEFQAKFSAASALLSREKYRPTVEVFGSTVLNDPGAPSSTLASVVPQNARASTTVGVRVTAPLDFSTLAKARDGYAAEAAAADYQFQRKVFEEERDWLDLTAKFRQAKVRLGLYVELEKTQREKLDYERDRQQRGRSTLQQVLLFENDYELAQLGRIRTLADLLNLNAQMKLYGVSYESR